MRYIALIVAFMFISCGGSNDVGDGAEQMPKGFTNDSIRIISIVPFKDSNIVYNPDGTSWSTSEYFVIKNYGSKSINLYSYKDTIDSTWIQASNSWRKFRTNIPTDSGWFFKAKKNYVPHPIYLGLKRHFGRNFPNAVLYQSYILEPKKTIEEKSPMVTADLFDTGYYETHLDLLENEGDTLYLYKYNKTDTVLVDMISWKNAQMNQVFYHE